MEDRSTDHALGDRPSLPDRVATVLASASRLQQVVPDAVLVGGTAAALYARHRESFDHDHIVSDLADRYEQILEAVEATDGWVTSVRASSPPLTLLGSLGGIEAGLRQLRRTRPLEVVEVDVPGAGPVRVPPLAEMLRIKSYLVVQRNQVRDHLDVVALTETIGIDDAATTLAGIDAYYADRSGGADSVLTALVQRLSQPEPRDSRVTRQLASYRGLDPRWHRWTDVVSACHALADTIVRRVEAER
ncbi:MAG: hypothetical protein M0P31_10410 [Solirubrobacteraceae bacterium]|nr:hypothetical protein [Solirubrobacteraceae bacterium]